MSALSCCIQTSSIAQLLFYRGNLYCDSIGRLLKQDNATAMISTHTSVITHLCQHCNHANTSATSWSLKWIVWILEFLSNEIKLMMTKTTGSANELIRVIAISALYNVVWIFTCEWSCFPTQAPYFTFPSCHDSVRIAELGGSSQIRRAPPAVLLQVSGRRSRLPRSLITWSAPAAKEWLFTGRRAAPVAVCFPLSCCLLPQSISCFQQV